MYIVAGLIILLSAFFTGGTPVSASTFEYHYDSDTYQGDPNFDTGMQCEATDYGQSCHQVKQKVTDDSYSSQIKVYNHTGKNYCCAPTAPPTYQPTPCYCSPPPTYQPTPIPTAYPTPYPTPTDYPTPTPQPVYHITKIEYPNPPPAPPPPPPVLPRTGSFLSMVGLGSVPLLGIIGTSLYYRNKKKKLKDASKSVDIV